MVGLIRMNETLQPLTSPHSQIRRERPSRSISPTGSDSVTASPAGSGSSDAHDWRCARRPRAGSPLLEHSPVPRASASSGSTETNIETSCPSSRATSAPKLQAFGFVPARGGADVAAFEVPDAGGVLSPREVEVLRLMAQGLSNRDVGERLYVSVQTVKSHMTFVLRKTGADNRTEAAAVARSVGLS